MLRDRPPPCSKLLCVYLSLSLVRLVRKACKKFKTQKVQGSSPPSHIKYTVGRNSYFTRIGGEITKHKDETANAQLFGREDFFFPHEDFFSRQL